MKYKRKAVFSNGLQLSCLGVYLVSDAGLHSHPEKERLIPIYRERADRGLPIFDNESEANPVEGTR